MLNGPPPFASRSAGPPPVWRVSRELVSYRDAVDAMERRAEAIAAGEARELVWLLEHPPLYTAGTSARAEDLLSATFPVFQTGRGGQYTYHGPGQRVVYVLLDLKRRQPDVRAFVAALEDWLILALRRFAVDGERRQGRVGVWVARPDKSPEAEDKIAALGVRVRRWVSSHGVSVNVEPDLSHYAGIVPCGVRGPGVTSLVDLGRPVTMDDVDAELLTAFEQVFGRVDAGTEEPLVDLKLTST